MPTLPIPVTAARGMAASVISTTCPDLGSAMRHAHSFQLLTTMMGCLAALASTAGAFEGRILAVMTEGTETNALLYTVGTNCVRVAMTATNWPNPVDIVDRNSGALTLLFPNNRSFVH